jgi:hypothetical protein
MYCPVRELNCQGWDYVLIGSRGPGIMLVIPRSRLCPSSSVVLPALSVGSKPIHSPWSPIREGTNPAQLYVSEAFLVLFGSKMQLLHMVSPRW